MEFTYNTQNEDVSVRSMNTGYLPEKLALASVFAFVLAILALL